MALGHNGAMDSIDAVIFDLDGTLTDSEHWWDEVRRALAAAHGRAWPGEATAAMMGMSTPEWAGYLIDVVGIPGTWRAVADRVIDGMVAKYRAGVPLLPGADAAIRRVAARWPVAICSSSPRRLIDAVVDEMGWAGLLGARVSTEEVPHGKPAPDGPLRAAELLGADPGRVVAIEDATNGLLAAMAAGMRTVAVPPHFQPPSQDVLACCDAVIDNLDELSNELISALR